MTTGEIIGYVAAVILIGSIYLLANGVKGILKTRDPRRKGIKWEESE